MQLVRIVALCVVAAVGYGIVHDQFTARICVEYFTIGHPPVFATSDPTWLGIGWGIIATWWVGVLLGVPLGIAARAGSRPKRSARSLLRPIAVLLLTMAVLAATAGTIAWVLASQGDLQLTGPIAEVLPREHHAVFLADLAAHQTSYLVGFLGGLVVIVRVWRSRVHLADGRDAMSPTK